MMRLTEKQAWVSVWVLGLASVSVAVGDTWTQKADMPSARALLSTCVVDGKIYAIGGATTPFTASSTVEAYDPVTDTWTRKADMPTARTALSTSVVNGKIYAIGGGRAGVGPIISPAPVEEYDPATDTWTKKSDMPTARAWLSGSVVNGKIYAIGGARGYESTVLSTVEEYDPVTDIWTRKADMPTRRAYVSTNAVNGKIYAIGGNQNNPWWRGISTVEAYDPATDTWIRQNDMPTPRTYFSTSVVNGKIYAIGGLRAGHVNVLSPSPVEEYDPATDTWTWRADMPTARLGLGTSAVNGKIYAIAGVVVGGAGTSRVEEYDIGLISPSPDVNGDGIVDIIDLLRLIESWGQDDPMVDLAPPPFGDGVVDALDLELLMSYWEQPLDDPTLIAHWKLDETEGMTAADSAGDNDAFVVGGAAWQPDSGQVDGAVELHGVDGCVIAGFVLNPADGPFSVFAWVNGGAPGQAILSQQGAANWLMLDPADGTLMTELKGSGRRTGPLQSQSVITDGNWHRIGLVWHGSYRALYVDDVLVAMDTAQQGGLSSSQGGFNIGAGEGLTAGSFWTGMIDDVRIYDRVIVP